jgi:outer membrane protein assembly factor BamB
MPLQRSLTPILICLVAVAVGLPAPASEVPDLRTRKVGSDWPRFLGPTGDGKSSETSLKLDWSEKGPAVRWVKDVGEGYSAPVTSRGRLFMFDRHGDRARLTCMNAETGEELWRQEYPTAYEDMYRFSGGPRTTPVVDDDRVYTFGVEGRLRCHRVVDGSLVWEVDTTERFGVVQNFFGVGSTPIVEGDLLIASVGGSPKGSPGIQSGSVAGNGSGIVAFDKKTGKVRYAVTDELASYSSPAIVDLGKRRLGLAFMRGGLVGFEPRSGEVDFRFPWRAKKLESVNASNPVIVGDRVLISESYGPGSALLRVRPGGYEVLWKDPRRDAALKTHWATPIHHEGYVYGCSGSGSGDAELRAIELDSGKVAWRQPGLGRVTLLLVEDHLVVLTERGRLLVVLATPEAYRPVADATPVVEGGDPLIEYPAWNAPVLSHGLLYLRGKTRLACLDLK